MRGGVGGVALLNVAIFQILGLCQARLTWWIGAPIRLLARESGRAPSGGTGPRTVPDYFLLRSLRSAGPASVDPEAETLPVWFHFSVVSALSSAGWQARQGIKFPTPKPLQVEVTRPTRRRRVFCDNVGSSLQP
ncbi:hypothetical protein B0J18DRAFT_309763 [Chaetomium sp. MPI-SDFR-AT-0129]|nr:hypothetical protein B0J18DRAFT_309763 [Chaetomium sp. MPI-SDFR-AT-0129]